MPLAGVGIDAERVERFGKLGAGAVPWRHVYSPREAAHLASLPEAALAFCAVFCIKEAVCKALGERYRFPECECLLAPGSPVQRLELSPGLAQRHGLGGGWSRLHEEYPAVRGECVAEARLFRAPAGAAGAPPAARSVLESLEIAAVERRRAAVAAADFSESERADLGPRRVQSLAGALALKRALAALWADAGTPAEPRAFVIGHLASGAPRLLAAPAGPGPERVFVSIAHTRLWAYGLATLAAGSAGG